MCIYRYTNMDIHVHTCTHAYTCVSIYIHIHTDSSIHQKVFFCLTVDFKKNATNILFSYTSRQKYPAGSQFCTQKSKKKAWERMGL